VDREFQLSPNPNNLFFYKLFQIFYKSELSSKVSYKNILSICQTW